MLFENCDGNCDNCPDRQRCQEERKNIRNDIMKDLSKKFPRLSEKLLNAAIDSIIESGSAEEAIERLQKFADDVSRNENEKKSAERVNFSIEKQLSKLLSGEINKENDRMLIPLVIPPDIPYEEVMETFNRSLKEVERKYVPWRGEFFEYHKQNLEDLRDLAESRYSSERSSFKDWVMTFTDEFNIKIGFGSEDFSYTPEDIGKILVDILNERKKEEEVLFLMSDEIYGFAKQRNYEEASILMEQFGWLRENRKSSVLKMAFLKITEEWEIFNAKKMREKYGNKNSLTKQDSSGPITEEDVKKFCVDDLLDNL